jgi:metallo-beta-lactamase class B
VDEIAQDMPISQLTRVSALLALFATFAPASASAATTPSCSQCAEWNVSQEPFRIYGNTYYVGVHGLSSILITSPQGLVLIDGDIAESAPKIRSVGKTGEA